MPEKNILKISTGEMLKTSYFFLGHFHFGLVNPFSKLDGRFNFVVCSQAYVCHFFLEYSPENWER